MESRALRSELAAERIDCASQVAVASESALTARAHAESLDARLESATRAAAERLELQKVAEGRAVSAFFSSCNVGLNTSLIYFYLFMIIIRRRSRRDAQRTRRRPSRSSRSSSPRWAESASSYVV